MIDDGRQRDRYGRLPRRKKCVTTSLEPDLHARLTTHLAKPEIRSSLSHWVAEAIEQRLAWEADQ